jgi:hypothetical protein
MSEFVFDLVASGGDCLHARLKGTTDWYPSPLCANWMGWIAEGKELELPNCLRCEREVARRDREESKAR